MAQKTKKIKKLEQILDKVNQTRENEYIHNHSLAYYEYLEKVFTFIKSFTPYKISWKVVKTGISIYISINYKSERFMSIDCHSNNKLKYEFFYPNAKAKLESSFFSRKTRIGGDDKYYWYYLNNLMFDEEVMQLIRDSYDAKISYLK